MPKSAFVESKKPASWSSDPPACDEMLAPCGPICIVVGPSGLERVVLPGANGVKVAAPRKDSDPRVELVKDQLREYFAGTRKTFDVPLDPSGTPFDLSVWRYVCGIPFGEVRTYADLAIALGMPGAFRAVGAANGRNPIPIFIPCHRVVGAGGRLTGYSGGVDLKAKLLRLEGCEVPGEAITKTSKVGFVPKIPRA